LSSGLDSIDPLDKQPAAIELVMHQAALLARAA
jgi:hypothetical protein